MEKYFIEQVSNGSISIVSEWTDKDKAIKAYHTTCANLWAAQDVVSATVRIADVQLDTVDGYKEIINKAQAQAIEE